MSEIKNRYTGEVICSGDFTVKELAVKHRAVLRGANLCKANLCKADLREADLCKADLYKADLCGANLYKADLREADLREADLRGADLCEAKYNDEILLKYFTISRIGTRNDTLQVFITGTNVILKTGCFTGTVKELQAKLKADVKEHEEYKIAIKQINAMVKLWRDK